MLRVVDSAKVEPRCPVDDKAPDPLQDADLGFRRRLPVQLVEFSSIKPLDAAHSQAV